MQAVVMLKISLEFLNWRHERPSFRKRRELEIVTNQLLQLREELKKAKTSPVLQESENEWMKQMDGQPRAGVIPKQIAEDNGMMELIPNSGIFVYPKDIRVVSKKTNGTAIAGYLMSVFYTNSSQRERRIQQIDCESDNRLCCNKGERFRGFREIVNEDKN